MPLSGDKGQGNVADDGAHSLSMTKVHPNGSHPAPEFDAVDLFAGPGGWDVGAAPLGLRLKGIEFNPSAASTRRAAGWATIEGDVRHYGPATVKARGLIGSPPCPTFSIAGKGSGRKDLDRVLAAVEAMRAGETPTAAFEDERTGLVLEPLRWALEAERLGEPYEWIALEQVPSALRVWEAFAVVLREHGYSVVTAVLSAEAYGVPQVRRRAILIASRVADVELPPATHSRYYPRKPAQLDDAPRWVTMAEALTWGMTHRPYPTVAVGTAAGGTDPQCLGGSGARRLVREEREAGRWVDQPADHPRAHWTPTFNDQSGTPFDHDWPYKRPATTVAGRGLVQNPGATANRTNGSTKSRNDGVRITVEEAGILQSFPADYPWQGKLGARYQQAGDAIPPLLARAVLQAATRKAVPARH